MAFLSFMSCNGRSAIKLQFTPNGAVGEFDAYLCFVLPEESGFSKFYKITGKSK